jgi:hypothetical protein
MGTNQQLTASFSEPMNPATILAPGTFTVTGPGATPVAGAVTYDATNNIAAFAPTGGNFATSTTFTATVTTAAESIASSPLATSYVWTFTTGASTSTMAPLVTSTNPVATSSGAGTNQKLTATFSEAMDSTTLTPTTFTLIGPGDSSIAGTVTYSTIGATATFTPSSALTAGSTYIAVITTGVTDLAGNALASDFFWGFTTGATTDTVAPTVGSTNPADAATGIGIDASINASFVKAMDPSTLNPVTFTVTGPGSTVVGGQVTYDVPDMIVTFTPSSPLAANSTFTAALTGALDLAGNPLPTFVWTFQTGATTTGLSPIDLGAATNFAAFAEAGATNAGATVVNGDLGLTPVATITGFPPGVVNGTMQLDNPAAVAALSSLTDAYNDAAGLSGATTVAENLAGQTLTPGLYVSAVNSFEISGGNLTLDAQGDANAVWVFQMPASTLTLTAPGCDVLLVNGAQASNIFWQVGTSATIAGGCVVQGSMLVNTTITLAADATVNGRAMAGTVTATGALTMSSNMVSRPACNWLGLSTRFESSKSEPVTSGRAPSRSNRRLLRDNLRRPAWIVIEATSSPFDFIGSPPGQSGSRRFGNNTRMGSGYAAARAGMLNWCSFARVIVEWVRSRPELARGGVPKWLRERSAKPPCIGSNPIAASKQYPADKATLLLSHVGRVARPGRLWPNYDQVAPPA